MKVIDLLNKKMNNEEIPEKFKYDNEIFIYDIEENDYIYESGNISFFNEYCSPIYNFEDFIDTLNDEIEIIEEHKIPKKFKVNWEIDEDNTIDLEVASDIECKLADKVNEIIDYLEEINNE